MLREARPDEAGKVNAIIASEIAAYDAGLTQPSGFRAPGEGAIWASMQFGRDVCWIDDDDPRRVVWVHPNDPKDPTMLFVMHAWAPSEKHDAHLKEITEVVIARGWGDIEIQFPRAGTPLTKIADEKFLRDDQQDGQRVGKTTSREANEQFKKQDEKKLKNAMKVPK